MSALSERLNLPVDRYQPYGAVAGVLERLREGPGPLAILDVSGGESALPAFLPRDRISEVPPGSRGAAPQVVGTLPFEDEAFDYVVGVDVYGLVEPGVRTRYLSELRRVCGKGVLLSGPFDSAVVRDAERIADEVRAAVGGEVGGRSEAGKGLPELDGARRFLEEQGDTVFVLPNGYVPHWLAMEGLSVYGAARGDELGGLLRRVNAFYNEFVCGLDNVEPSYRHLLVSLKETTDVDLGDLMEGAPKAGRAGRDLDLSGALFAMLPLTVEVGRLNARLVEKEGELARKEVQVDDLFGRLAGLVSAENAHRVHHANLQRINTDLSQQIDRITGSRSWRLLTLLRRIKLRISGTG